MMQFKKSVKVFLSFVLAFVLSIGCMTFAFAADEDAVTEDAETTEEVSEDVSEVESIETVEETNEANVNEPDVDESNTVVSEEIEDVNINDANTENKSETITDEKKDGIDENESKADVVVSENIESETTNKQSEPASNNEVNKTSSSVVSKDNTTSNPVNADVVEAKENSAVTDNAKENIDLNENVTNSISKNEAASVGEVKDTVLPDELLKAHKDGIYVALRDAGLTYNATISVMSVMDEISEFEVIEGGLIGWTDDYFDMLDEYSDGNTSSYAYQMAFLFDTIENPDEEGYFDTLKYVLMDEDSLIGNDVWHFVHDYVDEVNPENELDVSECIELTEIYDEDYKDYKDDYSDLISIFDMAESTNGQAVVDYACQFVGNPYVWGGVSLTNGADCSGFIQSVYAHFGVSLPHYSGALRSVGYEVSPDDLEPGDIICYDGHCAIYIGNGKIVHASNSRPYPVGGIKISDNYNYRTVLAIRRIYEPDEVIDIEPVIFSEVTDVELV